MNSAEHDQVPKAALGFGGPLGAARDVAGCVGASLKIDGVWSLSIQPDSRQLDRPGPAIGVAHDGGLST